MDEDMSVRAVVKRMMAKMTPEKMEDKFVFLFELVEQQMNQIAKLEVDADMIPFSAILKLRQEGVDECWQEYNDADNALQEIDAWIKKVMHP